MNGDGKCHDACPCILDRMSKLEEVARCAEAVAKKSLSDGAEGYCIVCFGDICSPACPKVMLRESILALSSLPPLRDQGTQVSDWKVMVRTPVFGHYVDLYIYRRIGDGEIELLTRDSKGNQILVSVNSYETTDGIKSTLRLNGTESGEILKSLAEAIHEQGVSTDNDARISGLLEATKEHLSDMRKIVFKDTPSSGKESA